MEPCYFDWVKDENDATNSYEKLPLVYLWGETVIDNDLHYVVSINNAIVGKKLKEVMLKFAEVRDGFAAMATELVQASITDTVKKLELPPSVLSRLDD